MKEFDKTIHRRGTNSVKWDLHKDDDLLHLWVADMDFAAPQAIQDALRQRVEHGVFGYTFGSEDLYRAIIHWTKERYAWSIERNFIVLTPGVVPALGVAVQAFTAPNEKVLIQSPVYAPFFDMVTKNGREVVVSPLIVQNGRYEMDWADLETKFKQGVHLMILCSPHNPVGRVWTKEELQRLGKLCMEYDVIIVSDDIHADIIFSGHVHTPLASLSDDLASRTITCIAPSKTFNIAGLQASASIIPNEVLRKQFTKVLQQQGFYSLNLFASTAMETAYTSCEDWLEDLLVYLEKNAQFAYEYIQTEIPELQPYQPEGTYLLWVDCSKLGLSKEERLNLLQKKGKIVVEPGEKFGPGGEGFIRLNLGCPRSMLKEALIRLRDAVKKSTQNV